MSVLQRRARKQCHTRRATPVTIAPGGCDPSAQLCGQYPLTGKNFDHRNVWIQERLAFLAGQSAIDICSIARMSNHVHGVLRNRPDIAGQWGDEEVARRWWNLFPGRKTEDGTK